LGTSIVSLTIFSSSSSISSGGTNVSSKSCSSSTIFSAGIIISSIPCSFSIISSWTLILSSSKSSNSFGSFSELLGITTSCLSSNFVIFSGVINFGLISASEPPLLIGASFILTSSLVFVVKITFNF